MDDVNECDEDNANLLGTSAISLLKDKGFWLYIYIKNPPKHVTNFSKCTVIFVTFVIAMLCYASANS